MSYCYYCCCLVIVLFLCKFGCFQELFLVLHSGISLGRFRIPYGMLGMEPTMTTCKASTLFSILPLYPLSKMFCQCFILIYFIVCGVQFGPISILSKFCKCSEIVILFRSFTCGSIISQ